MLQQNKNRALFFLTLGLAALLVLAAGLPGLHLRAGAPVSLGGSQEVTPGVSTDLPASDWIFLSLRIFLALMLALLPIYVLLHLLTPEGRRRLLSDLIVVLGFLVLLFGLSYVPRNPSQASQLPSQPAQGPFENLPPPGEAVSFVANTPTWMILAASLGVALAVTGAAAAILWLRSRRQPRATLVQRLARQAQQAVEEIQQGGEIQDTIIRCYVQMSRLLAEARRIQRAQSTTPAEFERDLIRQGLPEEAVRNLTRLFEKARYGNTPALKAEEDLAIECLTEIVRACEKAGAGRSDG